VRRLLTLLAQAAVVAALIAGTTAFVTADKTVTLSIDGQHRTFSTYAGTVAEALADQGITVDEHDLVTPMPSEKLTDGETVVVRYARPVVLTVDGETRSAWTTARNVGQALMLLGVRDDDAYVSASRSRSISRSGMALDVRLPHELTFLVDGRRHEIRTNAITIRSAMTEAGIRLRTRDRVTPGLDSRPADEQVIGITRVDGRRSVEERPIRFITVERKSKALFRGDRQIVRKGHVGVRVFTYRETLLDHRVARRSLVDKRIGDLPVAQIELVGTKKVPTNTPTADGLNWAALAQCESGGNPQAYNPAGPFYGLYQFMVQTWQAVGGVGLPSDATPDEQTYRAQILYQRSGAGQWPVCGPNLFS
jgi:uncharacterized protein YabE (DUF348 family)